jgi:hypothetical protein
MAVTRVRVAALALRKTQRMRVVAAPAPRERQKAERRESLPGEGAKGKGIDEPSTESSPRDAARRNTGVSPGRQQGFPSKRGAHRKLSDAGGSSSASRFRIYGQLYNFNTSDE